MRGRHIAEILDLSEATVETRISRARRMLRDLARDDEPDDYAPVAIAGLE
jgi:DNA-directed RNA polymerase specialized sigma24 family protein